MVDFNAEATVGTPAWDILRVLVLQRRDHFIEALEAYRRARGKGMVATDYEMQARLCSLFQELRAHLLNSLKEEEFQELEQQIDEPKDYGDTIKAWRIINNWLYSKELTKWDTRKRYDYTKVENENYETGLG